MKTKVVGVSGLFSSVEYRRARAPGEEPRMCRQVQGLDAAACMVSDGRVIAALAEERVSREKGTNRVPLGALTRCLGEARISVRDLDAIAHGFDYGPLRLHFEAADPHYFTEVLSPDSIRVKLEEFLDSPIPPERFIPVSHHLAHGASSFYQSGFGESLVAVVDGMGETESLSVFHGSSVGLKALGTIPARSSIGVLYGLVTHYLGFQMNQDEYKVMGLAAYGDPSRLRSRFAALVQFNEPQSFSIPTLSRDPVAYGVQSYERALSYLEMLFGPRRSPVAEIEQSHCDIAAAMQELLEVTLGRIFSHYKNLTQLTTLCLAGGVALNCCLNGKLLRSGLFRGIHVQPASGDDGSALGAALVVDRRLSPAPSYEVRPLPFWGPEFFAKECLGILANADREFFVEQVADDLTLTLKVSEALAGGLVVGWVQGRSEFGPRALGNRSILADPRSREMRVRINSIIKQREGFRPFAPAVLEEEAPRIFEIPPHTDASLETMLFTVPVSDTWRTRLGAVVHHDGTSRVQTVSKAKHPLFWQLISAFAERTGVPVLLNTSFNIDEPIVDSPADAWRTFSSSTIDILVMGRIIVRRKQRD